MKSIILASVLTCAVCAHAVPADAADGDFQAGPYAGIGLGTSSLDVDSRPSRNSKAVDTGVLKIYGGYQFTENFGVEGGYIRNGRIEVTDSVDGIDVTRTAKTRAAYLVATGALPLTGRFSVAARLGMSYGDVNDGDVAPIPNTVYGSNISVMAGAGVRYQLAKRMSLSLDYDRVGKESKQVSANVVTLTFRHSF